jgi:hypothetical protein
MIARILIVLIFYAAFFLVVAINLYQSTLPHRCNGGEYWIDELEAKITQ